MATLSRLAEGPDPAVSEAAVSEAADRREPPTVDAAPSEVSGAEATVSVGEAARAEAPVRGLPPCLWPLLAVAEPVAEPVVEPVVAAPASEPCDVAVSALSAAAIPITGKPANEIPNATAAPASAPLFATDIRKTPITARLLPNFARNRLLLP